MTRKHVFANWLVTKVHGGDSSRGPGVGGLVALFAGDALLDAYLAL